MVLAQPSRTPVFVKELVSWHCGYLITRVNAKYSRPYTVSLQFIRFIRLFLIDFNATIRNARNMEALVYFGPQRNTGLI